MKLFEQIAKTNKSKNPLTRIIRDKNHTKTLTKSLKVNRPKNYTKALRI